MRHAANVHLLIVAGLLLVSATQQTTRAQSQQEIRHYDRDRAAIMLSDVHEAVKKNYYDASFHGVDLDARYKTYKDRINAVHTLAEAFRTIAAYLYGLDDSHTFFLPPQRSYTINYGYRMQMIGDDCYITDVRPNTDAAEKLHPGDQVISLDGYAVNRKDLWQLQYYLNQLAPEVTTRFTVRSPGGGVVTEAVNTPYKQGQRFNDLTLVGGGDLWRLTLEAERQQQLLRNRYIEQGDLMIWKMPVFDSDPPEIDRLMSIARKHKALILDLRANPGGREDTLTYLAGSVFDHDVKIATRVMRKDEKQLTAKSRGKDAFAGKLIALVDSRSASAAELFSRVVQLEHRGTVLGDHTSGSVMEAQMYTFSAGIDLVAFYGASITHANLIMADGKSLEKVGVVPDEIILPTPNDIAVGRDPVLTRAAELGGANLDSTAAGMLFPFEWSPL